MTEGILGAIIEYIAKKQIESSGCLSRPDNIRVS